MWHSYLVIADDDPATHAAWTHYLQRQTAWTDFNRVYHFYQIDKLAAWIEKHAKYMQQPICYFIDNEFPGAKRNGLDLIDTYGLHYQAYLVTSKFESPSMCQKLIDKQIHMVPKPLFPYMDLRVCQPHPDGVLIDDNVNLGQLWFYQAKRFNKDLIYCNKVSDFLTLMPHLVRSTPIYIDWAISDARETGALLAEKVYANGFTNIYLVTGYERNHINCPACVKAVLGKEPPWPSYS